MMSATVSITANVSRYCASLTANDIRGGTQKKSNAATLTNAAATAGPRPNLSATRTTVSRNSITMFASSKYGNSAVATTVVKAHAPTAHALSLIHISEP